MAPRNRGGSMAAAGRFRGAACCRCALRVPCFLLRVSRGGLKFVLLLLMLMMVWCSVLMLMLLLFCVLWTGGRGGGRRLDEVGPEGARKAYGEGQGGRGHATQVLGCCCCWIGLVVERFGLVLIFIRLRLTGVGRHPSIRYKLQYLLRGGMVNRTCSTHKNLYIYLFSLTIFGPIYRGPS